MPDKGGPAEQLPVDSEFTGRGVNFIVSFEEELS